MTSIQETQAWSSLRSHPLETYLEGIRLGVGNQEEFIRRHLLEFFKRGYYREAFVLLDQYLNESPHYDPVIACVAAEVCITCVQRVEMGLDYAHRAIMCIEKTSSHSRSRGDVRTFGGASLSMSKRNTYVRERFSTRGEGLYRTVSSTFGPLGGGMMVDGESASTINYVSSTPAIAPIATTLSMAEAYILHSWILYLLALGHFRQALNGIDDREREQHERQCEMYMSELLFSKCTEEILPKEESEHVESSRLETTTSEGTKRVFEMDGPKEGGEASLSTEKETEGISSRDPSTFSPVSQPIVPAHFPPPSSSPLNGFRPEFFHLAALLYAHTRRLEDALHWIQRGLELWPSHIPSLHLCALVLSAQRRERDALDMMIIACDVAAQGLSFTEDSTFEEESESSSNDEEDKEKEFLDVSSIPRDNSQSLPPRDPSSRTESMSSHQNASLLSKLLGSFSPFTRKDQRRRMYMNCALTRSALELRLKGPRVALSRYRELLQKWGSWYGHLTGLSNAHDPHGWIEKQSHRTFPISHSVTGSSDSKKMPLPSEKLSTSIDSVAAQVGTLSLEVPSSQMTSSSTPVPIQTSSSGTNQKHKKKKHGWWLFKLPHSRSKRTKQKKPNERNTPLLGSAKADGSLKMNSNIPTTEPFVERKKILSVPANALKSSLLTALPISPSVIELVALQQQKQRPSLAWCLAGTPSGPYSSGSLAFPTLSQQLCPLGHSGAYLPPSNLHSQSADLLSSHSHTPNRSVSSSMIHSTLHVVLRSCAIQLLSRLWLDCAQLYVEMGREEDATYCLQEAYRITPFSSDVFYRTGLLLGRRAEQLRTEISDTIEESEDESEKSEEETLMDPREQGLVDHEIVHDSPLSDQQELISVFLQQARAHYETALALQAYHQGAILQLGILFLNKQFERIRLNHPQRANMHRHDSWPSLVEIPEGYILEALNRDTRDSLAWLQLARVFRLKQKINKRPLDEQDIHNGHFLDTEDEPDNGPFRFMHTFRSKNQLCREAMTDSISSIANCLKHAWTFQTTEAVRDYTVSLDGPFGVR